jgi:hypothetical protein
MANKRAELPDGWFKVDERGILVIDPDIAYPAILSALGVPEDHRDQYWVEVAYQCAKLEVQRVVTGTDADPRPDKALVIHILSDDGRKDRWALANLPKGKGEELASKGREARLHYQAWRGFIPG